LVWAFLAIPIQYYWIATGAYVMFLIFIPVYMFLWLPMRLVLARETAGFVASASAIQWGLMAFVFGLSHLGYLSIMAPVEGRLVDGRSLVLFLAFVTEVSAVFQYAWGKVIGRTKILPTISPHKTWEGFLGGIAPAIALSLLVRFLTLFSVAETLAASLLITVAGFSGGAVMSAVKRDVGVKDFGSLIPGHGGMIDRMDSLCYAAPVFFHISDTFTRRLRDLAQILFFALVLRPFMLLFIGLRVYGRDNLPARDPFVLIANHSSHLDTASLLYLFPLGRLSRIQPCAAADTFERTRAISFLSRTFFNALPIERVRITPDTHPVRRMREALERGHSLIFFPEGTRGSGETMAPFRSGIAHLIEAVPGIPIVPAYLVNMGRSLPKGEFIPVPFICEIHVGRPRVLAGTRAEILKALKEPCLSSATRGSLPGSPTRRRVAARSWQSSLVRGNGTQSHDRWAVLGRR
jgi:1-acyl-sn-glycerol-3-phosphate acyltransferase